MAIAKPKDDQLLARIGRKVLSSVHLGRSDVSSVPGDALVPRAEEGCAVASIPEEDWSRLTPMERRALERMDEHTRALRAAREHAVETR